MKETESINSYVKARRPDQESKDAINAYRSDASKLYDVLSIKRPAVIFSNDGTGFGKSYGVINTFLDGISANQSDRKSVV